MASIIEQIQFLIDKNTQLISDLHTLSGTIRSEIDVNELADTMQDIDVDLMNFRVYQSQVIQKRIEDNTASINNLIAQYTMSEEELDNVVKAFFKKASFNSSTLASSVNQTTYSPTISFVNNGVLYNWTEAKGIALKIDILDENGSSAYSVTELLDTDLAGNTPGDELLNEDFGKIKYFYPSIDLSLVPTGSYILRMYIKNTSEDFDDIYTNSLNIL